MRIKITEEQDEEQMEFIQVESSEKTDYESEIDTNGEVDIQTDHEFGIS
jgi:hypothetical protein